MGAGSWTNSFFASAPDLMIREALPFDGDIRFTASQGPCVKQIVRRAFNYRSIRQWLYAETD
ncbi:Uncharacterised protein [Dermatophilus congolensis]|uniref:Uncharacterized protein n=1 Tax=Dermatophilus congolensis TaxID=1863 RepID=A0AA46H0F6_9MICO|nr:Uncharacterised protein [Dermatophilus congolensis]